MIFGLIELINKQKQYKEINVKKIPPGTIIEVETLNSKYTIKKLEDSLCIIKGGSYFKEDKEVLINGSSFGCSIFKEDCIEFEMRMEIYDISLHKIVTTTPVQKARLIGSDWEFEMAWPD